MSEPTLSDRFMIFRHQECAVLSEHSCFGDRCLRTNTQTKQRHNIDFRIPYSDEGALLDSISVLIGFISLIPGLQVIGLISETIDYHRDKKIKKATERQITVPYVRKYRIAPAWAVTGILTPLWMIFATVMIYVGLQQSNEQMTTVYIVFGVCPIILIGFLHWCIASIWPPKHGFHCVEEQEGFYFIKGVNPAYLSELPTWPGQEIAFPMRSLYLDMTEASNQKIAFDKLKDLNTLCLEHDLHLFNPSLLPQDLPVLAPLLETWMVYQKNTLLNPTTVTIHAVHVEAALRTKSHPEKQGESQDEGNEIIQQIQKIRNDGQYLQRYKKYLVVQAESVFPQYCPTDNLLSPHEIHPYRLTFWDTPSTRWLYLIPGASLFALIRPMPLITMMIPMSARLQEKLNTSQAKALNAAMAFWAFTLLFGILFFIAPLFFETHWDTLFMVIVMILSITSLPSWCIHRYHVLNQQVFLIKEVHNDQYLLTGASPDFLDRLPEYRHPHQP